MNDDEAMDRASLEEMNRDALIAHAEQIGVTRARILTRPELIDEILIRLAAREEDASTLTKARGFFGIAKDLLTEVVQKGLHLPDAAERLRTMFGPPPEIRRSRDALPTVTLAEIYVAQGHRTKAIETLKRVLNDEPDHGAALALLAKLQDRAYPVPAPKLPPEDEEAELHAAEQKAAREKEEEDARDDVDECIGILVDRGALFVSWKTRKATLAALRSAHLRGRLVMRVLSIVPSWNGPVSHTRDLDLHAPKGDYFVRGLDPTAVVRAAIGWLEDGFFHSIAHSPVLTTGEKSNGLTRWTIKGAVDLSMHQPEAAPMFRAHALMRTRLNEAAP